MTECVKCGRNLTLAELHMARMTKRPVCYDCNTNDTLKNAKH